MPDADLPAKTPKERRWPTALSLAVEICDDGLVFGAKSVLVRMTRSKGGTQHLALDVDRARMLALLSVVYRRPVQADVLRHIEAASGHWQRGDKALANLRLVFAGLPRLQDEMDAARLRLAEYCLDEGLSPQALMTELGLDASVLGKYGYDPTELRDGRGRWARDAGGPRSASSTFDRPIVIASDESIHQAGQPRQPPKENAELDAPEPGVDEIRVLPTSPLELPAFPSPTLSTSPTNGSEESATSQPFSIEISASRFGEAAQHILDAQAAGHPSILTIDRDGANLNRAAATGRLPKVLGMHLDEYPLAMFSEGGANASVRAINPKDNLACGGYIGRRCFSLPNGSRIELRVVE